MLSGIIPYGKTIPRFSGGVNESSHFSGRLAPFGTAKKRGNPLQTPALLFISLLDSFTQTLATCLSKLFGDHDA